MLQIGKCLLKSTTISQPLKAVSILSIRFFESDLSLTQLYPNSKQHIFTPPASPINKEKFNGFIPIDQLKIKYDRSSGPGGQNVNKVATKVDLRFSIKDANWISDKVKERLFEQHKTRITRDGFFVIKSEVTRYQQMNLADALEKLRNIIREAEKPTKVELSHEKIIQIRENHERLARERLRIKRERSDTKAQRRAPVIDL